MGSCTSMTVTYHEDSDLHPLPSSFSSHSPHFDIANTADSSAANRKLCKPRRQAKKTKTKIRRSQIWGPMDTDMGAAGGVNVTNLIGWRYLGYNPRYMLSKRTSSSPC
ncbi:uncharacterized protein L203_100271 [Cryptococcus depauperatus CBS 7841]|uniref:Uncharacterized protein n=1 Tax=Cryptococcus depauperatus CBS 7841 TaxID=1295531 RepID=A0AAJ8JMV7_9TREE